MGMRSVLVHTDIDSPEAGLVLGLAQGLPSLGVERVVLANVLDASGLEGPVIMAKVGHVLEALRARARVLEDVGLAVECRVPIGDPARELLALSAEEGIDAVLSGSHGKSNVDRIFAGSVSEELAASASVPNIVVRFESIREADDAAGPLRTLGRRLLVPTDLSEAADRALDLALALPRAEGDTLLLVHVDDGGPVTEAGLRESAERAVAAGADATFVSLTGAVGDAVLAEAEARGATGIVMGTRGVGSPWGELVLGSLSLTLLRQAGCPVVIVP